MSPDGHTQVASIPNSEPRKPQDQDGMRVTGTFPERLATSRTIQPIADEDRLALRILIEAGKLQRQRDGGFGIREKTKRLLTSNVANRLKRRDLAIGGFNRELVPTIRARQMMAGDVA